MIRRIEWMAVGWGGLISAIGLLLGSGWGTPARAAALAIAFALGGFLAGVRAEMLRPLHAAMGAIAAYAFHALFVALGHVADAAGGPSAPELVPGANNEWGLMALGAVAIAAAGGWVAALWLRPQADQRRRRVA